MQNLDPSYVKTVEQIMKNVWKEKKGNMKVGKDSLALSAELLNVFITEAINRSAQIAKTEGSPTIELAHLEKILPQLLLDF